MGARRAVDLDDITWAREDTLAFLVKLGLIHNSAGSREKPVWLATEDGAATYLSQPIGSRVTDGRS